MSASHLATRPARSFSDPVAISRPRSGSNRFKSDPFFELSAAPIQSPSPLRSEQQPDETEPPTNPESLFSQLIVSPLLFTSFLLSLFLVDRQYRAYRVSEHPSNSSAVSLLSRALPTSWWDPEPYADSGENNNGAGYQKKQPWYLKKKHRRVANMEITEAFQLRTRVIVGLVAGMLTVLAAGAAGMKKVYEWTWAG